jgi:hypothetical protein
VIYRDHVAPVLAHFEGCPEELAVDALRNSMIEFCRKTYGWQTGIVIPSDEPTSPMATTVNVIDICDARIEGATVEVLPMNVDSECCADYTIRFVDPNTVELEPTPSPPVDVEFLIIVVPTPWSDEGPDHIWNEYHEALRAGAIARLHMGAGSWASPNRATPYAGMFGAAMRDAEIQYARNRRNRGRRLRVTPADRVQPHCQPASGVSLSAGASGGGGGGNGTAIILGGALFLP